MRITAFILLVCSLHVTAKSVSQTITLSGTDIPLRTVFAEIKKQCGYLVVYNRDIINDDQVVSVEVREEPLVDFLNRTLREHQLGFDIENRTIILKKQSAPPAALPPITVKGKVVNEAGEPVEGVTVMIKGTATGTVTNALGEFEIGEVPEKATLVFTSTAIEKLELKVNARTQLTVGIKRKISPLDEVQVIPYGATTARLNTGNVTTVKAKDIEKQPVNNPLLALQGRVPGMMINQANGLPGSGITVRIQGQNSLSRGNDPLYIIDGVPYTSQNREGIIDVLGRSGNSSPGGLGSGNPMSFINPADIESINILKDADATAIYGSRAANGAILITTKKGKVGSTKVDINLQNGWGKVTRKMDLLNTQQYIAMRLEALKNDGLIAGPTDYDVNGTWDTTRNTDWQKELIGGTAHYTDVQGSVSGGTENIQFLIGAGYHRETLVFPGNNADQKKSIHFHLNNVSPNRKFRIQLIGSYMVDNNKIIATDLTKTAINLAPNAPSLHNLDGTLNWAPDVNGNSSWRNPLSYLEGKYKNTTHNLIGNLIINYAILPSLELRSSFGFTNMQTNEFNSGPISTYSPETRAYELRYSVFGNSDIQSWIAEPQVVFSQHIGKGILESLVGASVQQSNSTNQRILAYGYNSDLILEDPAGAPNRLVFSGTPSNYRYNGLFGRINYNWNNKYVLNFNVRRDGSSRFGSENLFHNFGSVAAAWIFSNEKLIKNTFPFLSFGKLRMSYGSTGNDQIGDYQFMTLYNATNRNTPYQGGTGFAPVGLPNPYLQWEETRKFQMGLDFGFLKDRILFNANYYRNRSSNQLQSYALPIITGFSSIDRNFDAVVQNSGLELTLNTTNLQAKDFQWLTSINLTIPKNKLIRYHDILSSSYADTYIVGQPITIVRYYRFGGVDASTGLYQIVDSKGNLTSAPDFSNDRTEVINTDPTFYGGFQNSFSYNGLRMDVLFQFVKQIGYNYIFGDRPGRFLSDAYGTNLANQPTYVLDRWQKPGDNSSVQRFTANYISDVGEAYSAAFASGAHFSDASFVRLKNISISWQIPVRWVKRVHLENGRLFVQGQNLLTITNYNGMDPETKSSTTLPPLRVLTMGCQITL